MAEGPFLAVDWGTTNRRVFRFDTHGQVEETIRDGMGITAIKPSQFAGEVAQIRERMGDLPMLCAGMIGSNRGWVEVPYVACPAKLNDLVDGMHWLSDGRTAIVPGVKWLGVDRTDVMRGEEVQFLGAVVSDPSSAPSLLCQPGTHCKWAQVMAGSIDRFTTSMTGELFSLIQRHSLLAPLMTGTAALNVSFRLGLRHAQEGALPAMLFSVRADHVAGRHEIECASSYVSGLLIGADVKDGIADVPGEVHVLADPTLGALYTAAIEAMGGHATMIDSHAAFVRGINSIWSAL